MDLYFDRENIKNIGPWQFSAVKYQPLWKHFSSSIFTRMISSPIWLIHSQGMIYSLSRPNRQQNLPGPGSIRAVSWLLLQSNSASMGHPRLRQVQILITSFCFNSQIFINQIQSFRLKSDCRANAFRIWYAFDNNLCIFAKIYASPFIDTLNRNTV